MIGWLHGSGDIGMVELFWLFRRHSSLLLFHRVRLLLSTLGPGMELC